MPDILLWYRVNKKNKKKLMRVFKFHANSQGVKKTLEPNGYPKKRRQKKICIFSLYDYVRWQERLAVSAVSAKETIVFHLL